MTPWMTLIAELLKEVQKHLQFGHGGDAVDDSSTSGRMEKVGTPSIRPRR